MVDPVPLQRGELAIVWRFVVKRWAVNDEDELNMSSTVSFFKFCFCNV